MKDIAAAFIFFTRLPLWKISALRPEPEHYRRVIGYWPVVGWFTGAATAAALWMSAQVFPYSIAVILALLCRTLITGALHEDGLADFIDGFGGGNSRERILEIMKDSRTGTYGIAGLIFYYSLLFALLSQLPAPTACMVVAAADPLCKFICSLTPRFLQYARTAETAKSKTVYIPMSLGAMPVALAFGLLPLALIPDPRWLAAVAFPVATFIVAIRSMKRKIGGYTGDCCGAAFLLCELSFYLAIVPLTAAFPQ
jgi:adenosylcobinamide-GDP ribazoletransferase